MIITVFYFQEKKNCDMKLLYQPKVHKEIHKGIRKQP